MVSKVLLRFLDLVVFFLLCWIGLEDLLSTYFTIPYVLASINESLRRYPPAGVGLPRVTPPGGAMIAGVFVPKNTAVACWQLAMNHADAYWEAPYELRPGRFLDESKSTYAKDRMEAMQPFSVGPRNCIARNMASAEARLVLAQVLYNFDLTLAEPEKADWLDWLNQNAYVIWDTPLMRVIERGSGAGSVNGVRQGCK
jgi:cytochrome P450